MFALSDNLYKTSFSYPKYTVIREFFNNSAHVTPQRSHLMQRFLPFSNEKSPLVTQYLERVDRLKSIAAQPSTIKGGFNGFWRYPMLVGNNMVVLLREECRISLWCGRGRGAVCVRVGLWGDVHDEERPSWFEEEREGLGDLVDVFEVVIGCSTLEWEDSRQTRFAA